MTTPAVEDFVSKMKRSGFWSQATERRLRDMIAKLKILGLLESEVFQVIEEIWLMVAAEYEE